MIWDVLICLTLNATVTCRHIVRERVGKTRFYGDGFLETSPSLCDKQTFPWIRKWKVFSVGPTWHYITRPRSVEVSRSADQNWVSRRQSSISVTVIDCDYEWLYKKVLINSIIQSKSRLLVTPTNTWTYVTLKINKKLSYITALIIEILHVICKEVSFCIGGGLSYVFPRPSQRTHWLCSENGDALDLYLGGAQLESQPGHQVSWLLSP
jgi:hypothetical protein